MVSKPIIKQQSFFKTGLRIFSSVLLYILFWVIATPLCFLLLKSTKRSIRLSLLSGFLLIVFYSIGFLSFWIMLLPVLSVELAILLTNTKVSKYSSQLLILALCGAATLHFGIFAIYEAIFPKKLSLQVEDWFYRINDFWSKLVEQLGSNSEGQSFINQNWYEYIGYIPSVYFLSLIVGVFSCFWRHKILKNFKNPDLFFWAAIVSFSLGFLNWDRALSSLPLNFSDVLASFETYQIYFKNIFIVLSGLYFFQGLSVSSYLMEKFKIARFWQNLWYILVVLNLPVILVFMGLIDFLFEFRSFKETK